jgi:short-subunit dehydrogenase
MVIFYFQKCKMKKLLVVTGGTGGIGLAAIKRFASAGFDILTGSRSADRLAVLKKNISDEFPGTEINVFKADLSVKTETIAFVSFIKSLNRIPDVLINNAGLFFPGRVHDEPEGNLEFLMQLNVFSPYYITRSLIQEMISRKSGHIFNICSTASITAYSNGGAYSISKFALYGMTKVLREEMKPHNIRVTAILPGATLTGSWAGTDLPPERFMKPEDVAEAIFNAWSLSSSAVVEEIVMRPQLGDIQ